MGEASCSALSAGRRGGGGGGGGGGELGWWFWQWQQENLRPKQTLKIIHPSDLCLVLVVLLLLYPFCSSVPKLSVTSPFPVDLTDKRIWKVSCRDRPREVSDSDGQSYCMGWDEMGLLEKSDSESDLG